MKVYLRLSLYDRNGKRLWTKQRRSHSFVLQFLKHINRVTHWDSTVTAQTIVWGVHSIFLGQADNSGYTLMWAGPGWAGDANAGIVVGSGSTAESNSDYALATIIASGVAAGQLSYSAVSFTSAAVVGANVDFIIHRTFNNGSGGTVTVNEIGIHGVTYESPGIENRYGYLLLRDVITPTAVLNGQTLAVDYTLRTTV